LIGKILDYLRRKARPLDKDQLGHQGEQLAAHHLKKHDYVIITMNFRTALGEIDLIALKENTLIFLEVKTREKELSFGRPANAVTTEKQKRIRRIAEVFIKMRPAIKWKTCRFDVVEVITDTNGKLVEINHIKSAF
jgi:putative endonuclease